MATPASSVELVLQNRYERAMAAISRGQANGAAEALESMGELAGKAIRSGDVGVGSMVERYSGDIGAMAVQKGMLSVLREAARVITEIGSVLGLESTDDDRREEATYEAADQVSRLVDASLGSQLPEGARLSIATLGDIGVMAASGGFGAAAASVTDRICSYGEKASYEPSLEPVVSQAADAVATIAMGAMEHGDSRSSEIAGPFLERLCRAAIETDNRSMLQDTVNSQVLLYTGARRYRKSELMGSLTACIVEAKTAAEKTNPDLVPRAVRTAQARLKGSDYEAHVPSRDKFD